MPRVIIDGTPIAPAYEPPPRATQQREGSLNGAFVQALSDAITQGFRNAVASMPPPVVNVEAPVVNIPKPEIKINSPVYVTVPEVKIPPTTVNVPDGKAPVVNIEPAAVTLKTERPNKWLFDIKRDEFGRMTTIIAEDISGK
jgi:hypothetical protein